MSEHITRVSLDVAFESDRTDWARLAALSDADLKAAIANDTNTFALPGDASENLQFLIFEDMLGTWRWRLTDASGQAIAESSESYRLRSEAEGAIASLRRALKAA